MSHAKQLRCCALREQRSEPLDDFKQGSDRSTSALQKDPHGDGVKYELDDDSGDNSGSSHSDNEDLQS